MEEIVFNTYGQYGDFKKELDSALRANVESFVNIGYMLKLARDTDVLKDSGYKNVAEFAQAEYGLTKDIVSRYIAINDRYSEGGYSNRLKTQYEGYGVAKLQEMLTLPDSIIEEIEPTLTRKQLQEIKKELAEEEKVTPLEVMMEAAEPKNVFEESEMTHDQRMWKAHFKECKEEFLKLEGIVTQLPFPEKADIIKMVDVLAPTGYAVLWARVAGVGRLMITVKGADVPITVTNTRDASKRTCTAEEAYGDIATVFSGELTKEMWEAVYGEPFEEPKAEPVKESAEKPEEKKAAEPKKVEVAPVQQNAESIMPEPVEDTSADEGKTADIIDISDYKIENVTETAENVTETAENVAETAENVAETAENVADEQIPGQKNIYDYKEAVPEELEKVEAEVVEEKEEETKADRVSEHSIILKMMDTIQLARRTLAAHIDTDDGAISDFELSNLYGNAQDIINSIKKIREQRKEG